MPTILMMQWKGYINQATIAKYRAPATGSTADSGCYEVASHKPASDQQITKNNSIRSKGAASTSDVAVSTADSPVKDMMCSSAT